MIEPKVIAGHGAELEQRIAGLERCVSTMHKILTAHQGALDEAACHFQTIIDVLNNHERKLTGAGSER